MRICSEQLLRVCSERKSVTAKRYSFTSTVSALNERIREINLVNDNINFVWKKKNDYGVSRFSDGTWPVLYTAADEITAVTEVFHHLYEAKRIAGNLQDDDSWDLLIFSISFSGKCANISVPPGNADILHPKKEMYSHGHKLAKEKKDEGYDAIKIRSARRLTGTCYPIFTKSSANLNPGIQVKACLKWSGKTKKAVIDINSEEINVKIDDVYSSLKN